MPTTTTHQIAYPSGSQAPNVPLVMQTQAESVDAALSKVTKAPLILCLKSAQQTMPAAGVPADITWDVETHKQGITHTTGSALFTITEAGIYQLNCRVAFQGGTGTATITAFVNGQAILPTLTDVPAAATAWPKPSFTYYLKLNVNDVVKINGHHSVSNTIISSSESSMQIIKLAVF